MDGFPRWRVFRRHVATTESRLGSLPMVIVTPAGGAVVGATLAVSVPTRLVIRNGAVVDQTSFLHVLGWGVVGAVLGILAVAGLVVLSAIVYYHLWGDPTWKVRWSLGESMTPAGVHTRYNSVELVCTSNPPAEVAALGDVEVIVRFPNGEYRRMPRSGLGDTRTGLWSPVLASAHGPVPPGKYEVRWYGTTRRLARYEIARAMHIVQ